MVVSSVPICDSAGQFYGIVLICHDITGSKHMERQGQQAQMMQAIGTLAGGIAQEFNNILTIVLGFTEMTLHQVPEESQARANLQHVLAAGHRAEDLVNQLLAFSRPTDTGHRPTPLTGMVKDVLRCIRTSLPATITIQTRWDDGTGMIMADPSQIHQIVSNLCANAAHAMREKGGLLELRVETVTNESHDPIGLSELSSGPYLRLTVRDTGCGIPARLRSRIFEPFYTTKDVGDGTGMGLAIVHGIVTGHRGAISVESQVGHGTTITVDFQKVASLVPESAVPAPRRHNTGCILCVEDEVAILEVLELMLSQLGYDAIIVQSGPEALTTFGASPERFDLVITDNRMPEMMGTTLIEELRKIRPHTPVIVYTGLTQSLDTQRIESLEIDALLLNPLDLEDLGLVIRQVLEKRRTPVS